MTDTEYEDDYGVYLEPSWSISMLPEEEMIVLTYHVDENNIYTLAFSLDSLPDNEELQRAINRAKTQGQSSHFH